MIMLPLNLKSRFACACAPGENNCPYCGGEPGALPNINRDALEKGLELVVVMGLKPVSRIEAAYLPDPSDPRGYRLCTSTLSLDAGIYLSEDEDGGAVLVLMEKRDVSSTGIAPVMVNPGDALEEIASAYIAMDLPPIRF